MKWIISSNCTNQFSKIRTNRTRCGECVTVKNEYFWFAQRSNVCLLRTTVKDELNPFEWQTNCFYSHTTVLSFRQFVLDVVVCVCVCVPHDGRVSVLKPRNGVHVKRIFTLCGTAHAKPYTHSLHAALRMDGMAHFPPWGKLLYVRSSLFRCFDLQALSLDSRLIFVFVVSCDGERIRVENVGSSQATFSTFSHSRRLDGMAPSILHTLTHRSLETIRSSFIAIFAPQKLH